MFRTTTLRRLAPVALLAASTMVLAACGDSKDKDKTSSTDKSSSSPSPSTDANGCGTFSSGKTSDSVKVTGDFGQKQTATFSTPLKATSLERTVVDEGTGAKTTAGQTLDTLISVYLGKDGKALGSQPVSLTAGDAQMIQAFTAGIDCVPIGSRVVVTAPAKDMYGEEGNSQLGITAEDSLVIVTDVIGEKEQVAPQAWKQDVPKVTFDAAGKPTLKLPDTKPPADLVLKVLKPGDGDVVKAGDTVTLDYQGTNWRTAKVFDESYGKQPASFATTDVVEGFGAALVGQKVGTRLVVSIPPKYGYGETGSEQAGIKGTDTIVFVVEIKSTATS
jgi:FKBP-type peptidyl-prolyl cis-trans isomerase